jgi:hypothetical protein
VHGGVNCDLRKRFTGGLFSSICISIANSSDSSMNKLIWKIQIRDDFIRAQRWRKSGSKCNF